MKLLNNLIFFLILCLIASNCSTNNDKISSVHNGIVLKTSEMNVRVQFCSDDIVRVVKWTDKGSSDKKSLIVLQDSFPPVEFVLETKGNNIVLASNAIQIEISKNNGKILFYDKDENLLLNEDKSEFTPVKYKSDEAFSVKQNFRLTSDEGIYGLGQHQNGYMNYRGKNVVLVQSNTEAVIPFLISTSGYGILWDNYSKTVFDDKSEGASLWSDVADNIDYYFITGKNMDEIIAGYRDLSGHAPMYGKWAYGYWQSKEHYDTGKELLDVAIEYRKRQIPIDNIIQDWDYWNGRENWGGMFFDKTLFPEPEKMIKKLHDMNYHLMISVWPALGPNTEIHKEMDKHGFLYKPIGWAGFKYYDAFNPEANQLYYKYLKNGLMSKGVDAWWLDSTEPDVINALTKDATEYEMKKVDPNYLGSWARYLNAFSLSMTDALYKNLRAETSDQRAYILTRSAYAGQQRNAATTWSGDIGAGWDIYRNQISAGINHCMAGIPYWTFDIGSFVLGAYEGVFSEGGKDPAYQELYTRMFQFGAFVPIFRSHGSETPREIWHFGEFVPVLLQYDNLRYRLMPYIYSLAWKVTNEGYTMMRGLPMDFTKDKNTYSIDDQFMFGPSIMANPVTEVMYHRPPERSVVIDSEFFKTNDGKTGLNAKYYKDPEYKNLSLEKVDSNISLLWYSGRPDYVTDSMYAIRWEGKIVPNQTGKHQFHLKCFDAKRLYLDGKQLNMIYTSTEQYTEFVNLEAGKEYSFVFETENRSTGASRVILCWKTPDMFEKEKMPVEKEKTREVYLPEGSAWYDFWTGKTFDGGTKIKSDAPIEIMPLMVKAGAIIPMGPFLQYASEKTADPIELRIYPGADGNFTFYEDENDNYNYEKGIYATINFIWDDKGKTLTINKRQGEFPGMLKNRTFKIILVKENHGTGVEISDDPDKTVLYNGTEQTIKM